MKMIATIILAIALAINMSVSAWAAPRPDDPDQDDSSATITFDDAADIHAKCKDAVAYVAERGIMVGDGKKFNPNAPVTRAQMAKILCLITEDASSAIVCADSLVTFTDVEQNAWYNPYVTTCAAMGWAQGYNGKFDPHAELTIPAAAKMLLTAMGYDAETHGFVGINWVNNVLAFASNVGLLDGVDTSLTEPASRQWVAYMVANAVK